jgi:hypothetical protein
VPLLVAYFTLTAPVVPPLRFTDNVAEPLLLFTVYAREENATACADAVDPLPAMVTVADVGVTSFAAPVACDNAIPKVKLPLNAAELTGTTIVLPPASPAAQLKAPDFAV